MNMRKLSRRRFIKKTIILGNIIAGFPLFFPRNSIAEKTPRIVVHPKVDKLRVVTVNDNSMTKDYDTAI